MAEISFSLGTYIIISAVFNAQNINELNASAPTSKKSVILVKFRVLTAFHPQVLDNLKLMIQGTLPKSVHLKLNKTFFARTTLCLLNFVIY